MKQCPPAGPEIAHFNEKKTLALELYADEQCVCHHQAAWQTLPG